MTTSVLTKTDFFTGNVYNENGEKVLYGQNGVYIQNMGGYGGKRKSSISKETQSPPNRKPDATIQEKTSVDQVMGEHKVQIYYRCLYSLSSNMSN